LVSWGLRDLFDFLAHFLAHPATRIPCSCLVAAYAVDRELELDRGEPRRHVGRRADHVAAANSARRQRPNELYAVIRTPPIACYLRGLRHRGLRLRRLHGPAVRRVYGPLHAVSSTAPPQAARLSRPAKPRPRPACLCCPPGGPEAVSLTNRWSGAHVRRRWRPPAVSYAGPAPDTRACRARRGLRALNGACAVRGGGARRCGQRTGCAWMASPLERTSTPGVYARGSRWVAFCRAPGRCTLRPSLIGLARGAVAAMAALVYARPHNLYPNHDETDTLSGEWARTCWNAAARSSTAT
jgi:hypothetical protein